MNGLKVQYFYAFLIGGARPDHKFDWVARGPGATTMVQKVEAHSLLVAQHLTTSSDWAPQYNTYHVPLAAAVCERFGQLGGVGPNQPRQGREPLKTIQYTQLPTGPLHLAGERLGQAVKGRAKHLLQVAVWVWRNVAFDWLKFQSESMILDCLVAKLVTWTLTSFSLLSTWQHSYIKTVPQGLFAASLGGSPGRPYHTTHYLQQQDLWPLEARPVMTEHSAYVTKRPRLSLAAQTPANCSSCSLTLSLHASRRAFPAQHSAWVGH
jgi:hypothetical protein